MGQNLCGSSMVVGPDGTERVIASASEEELLIAGIDLEEVREVRRRIPYWDDLKKGLLFNGRSGKLLNLKAMRLGDLRRVYAEGNGLCVRGI